MWKRVANDEITNSVSSNNPALFPASLPIVRVCKKSRISGVSLGVNKFLEEDLATHNTNKESEPLHHES